MWFMRYNFVITLFLFFIHVSCSTRSDVDNGFRRGDLIFQVSAGSEFSDAINSAACANPDSLIFSHVGIVDVDLVGEIYVIEAVPHDGVRRVGLKQFLADCDSASGKPLAQFRRLIVPFSPDSVISKATSYLGVPYDYAFLPGIDALYCSELVYEVYIDSVRNHIFETTPMNFRDSDGNMPAYWIDEYARMGIPIPEGEPGTHPNTLAHSPLLRIVNCRIPD